MVVYHTVVHQTRQNEAVQYLAKTFAGTELDIKRSTFPIGNLHLYIRVSRDMSTVDAAFFCVTAPFTCTLIELADMHDIPTIPVMHPTIQASMEE